MSIYTLDDWYISRKEGSGSGHHPLWRRVLQHQRAELILHADSFDYCLYEMYQS